MSKATSQKSSCSFVERKASTLPTGYVDVRSGIVELLHVARQAVARNVNSLMTASYWEIGHRIVEAEQKSKRRAGYGEQLTTAVAKKSQTASAPLDWSELANAFALPWSAYVRLLSVKNDHARQFYEVEALRGGWSVRQLDCQIGSQFYERTALSKNKAVMLTKGAVAKPEDAISADEAIKDPYVLEFLNLKDEYSKTGLEEALIHRLKDFLLELDSDFTFVGRQRRLCIDQTWYRVDLLFFHRSLRCLVIIDLKLSSLTHADVGQMHMYCNYANENPPVDLILCADKGHALARYALDGLPNKIMAANYKTVLPDAEVLQKELDKARLMLESCGVVCTKDVE